MRPKWEVKSYKNGSVGSQYEIYHQGYGTYWVILERPAGTIKAYTGRYKRPVSDNRITKFSKFWLAAITEYIFVEKESEI